MQKFDYVDGRLWHGDCLELMKDIPDGSIDMVITDPPYTMTKTGNSCRPNYMPDGEILDGKVPSPKEWMSEVYRIMNEQSHFYTFCNRNDLIEYLNVAVGCGFKLHNIINMIKDTKMPNRWYLKYTEPVLFFRKGKAKAINDMTSRDYEFVTMPKGSDKHHPTEKPLAFIQKLITNSCKIGDIVLDPFSGSGTTAIAARNTGRKWVCIEQDETYFEKSRERIEKHVVLDV